MLTCIGQDADPARPPRHLYDMRLTNQKGDVAAMFRGKSARIAASVIPAG
jgi:hypothetical protein